MSAHDSPVRSGAHTLRVMVLADEPSPRLWTYFRPERLEGIDLILAAGDLPADYLSFLTCFTHAPILYIHGNHDGRYEQQPPEGCECIEDTVYNFRGLRILGLGGSMRYHPHTPQYTMYSEHEMVRRIRKLRYRLWKSHGFDILLTHAPAHGQGDDEDLAHRGFDCFLDLIERYHPSYLIHGHVHKSYMGGRFERERICGDTTIVNAWQDYVLEIEVPNLQEEKLGKHQRRLMNLD